MLVVTSSRAVLESFGPDTVALRSVDEVRSLLATSSGAQTVVLGAEVPLAEAVLLASTFRSVRPEVGVVLVRDHVDAGVLTEALRAGVREVVPSDDVAGLLDAVGRSDEISHAFAHRAPATDAGSEVAMGRVVTVFSAKGGCGKTTISTNLGAALADKGRRSVVIVDLDLAFGDVAIALQLFPAHTIADAVPLGEKNLDFAGLQALLTPHSAGLTTLVAPVEPGAAETIPASLVTRIIEVLRENFDYVVIDTPPAFDDQVLAAFDLSDAVVLLATLDIPALKNLKLTLETLDLLNYPRDRWKIVLNRSDSKVGLAISEVEKTLRTSITAQVPSSRDVPASINRGVPIMLDDPRHPVSMAIRGFAERDIAAGPGHGSATVAEPLRNDRRFLRRRTRT
jgi:pilus assembly protein CpaE